MKKSMIILIFSLMALVCQAQTEHMKFMGILLDGTITQFQNKLHAKGYSPNAKLNPHLEAGTRAFTGGTFIGKKADIAVYYDASTKIVHGAKALFEDYTESKAKDEIVYLKELLQKKYPDDVLLDDSKNDLPCFTIITDLGSVYVYARKNEDLSGYPYHFTVHIEYTDHENLKKHDKSIMDDL